VETLALAALALLHLIENRRRTAVPEYELQDVRNGKIDKQITGRAQSATCVFCRRTVTSWGARPASKRRALSIPESLVFAIGVHTPSCAERWLWTVLSRWSIGLASEAEAKAILVWRDRNYGLDSRRRSLGVAAMFDRLPHPPGSPIAQEIEVALIAISRLWQH
jgi:hypothetical protein